MSKGWNYQHVSEYLKWVKAATAYTAAGGTVRTNWAGAQLDAEAFRREFVAALHTRINLKGLLPVATRVPFFMAVYHRDARSGKVFSYASGPEAGRRVGWRKLDSDWQVSAWRDSRRARDAAQRVRVYQFETQEARERLGHLLSSREDW